MTLTPLLLSLALLATPAYAQEAPSENQEIAETGSGETLSAEEKERKARVEARRRRGYGFVLRFNASRDEYASHKEKQLERRTKRIEHLASCREEIRRANKVTKFSVMTRCFKAEQTQRLTMLRKEQSNLENIPGVTEEIAAAHSGNIDTLADAMSAIIDAIETGVYSSEADYKEAKTLLNQNYWKPYWLTRTHVKVDQALSWVAHVILRIEDTIEAFEEENNREAKLREAISCFENSEKELESILLDTNLTSVRESFAEARTSLQSCMEHVRDAHEPEEVEETEEGPEESNEEEQEETLHKAAPPVPQASGLPKNPRTLFKSAPTTPSSLPRRLQRRFGDSPHASQVGSNTEARERETLVTPEEKTLIIPRALRIPAPQTDPTKIQTNNQEAGVSRRLRRALSKTGTRFGQ